MIMQDKIIEDFIKDQLSPQQKQRKASLLLDSIDDCYNY